MVNVAIAMIESLVLKDCECRVPSLTPLPGDHICVIRGEGWRSWGSLIHWTCA